MEMKKKEMIIGNHLFLLSRKEMRIMPTVYISDIIAVYEESRNNDR